jgi:hypothetical protein
MYLCIYVNMRGVYQHASCDRCGMSPIVGQRWQCQECDPSYDLCRQCYKVHENSDPATHDKIAVDEHHKNLQEDAVKKLQGMGLKPAVEMVRAEKRSLPCNSCLLC